MGSILLPLTNSIFTLESVVMAKVLITGANGFVGQHLTALLKDSHQLIDFNAKLEDQSAIEKIFAETTPDVIFHLAGIANTWQKEAEDLIQVNFLGTLNLYQAIVNVKKLQHWDPKIVYISSSDVYGSTEKEHKIDESSLLLPSNFYATSKVAADRLSYQFSQSEKLNIVILRPFPHIGPGQKKGFFVPDMASQIVELEKGEEDEILVGNLDGIRDYLDVRDVVAAYEKFIDFDFKPGEVFNICSSLEVKIGDLLSQLIKFSHKEIKIKNDPTRIRQVEISYRVGNNSKLIEKTGWNAKINLEQTLKDTLDYWRTKEQN